MIVDIAERDLKGGVLGIVVALVEVIAETLRLQAIRRMESGSLTPEQMESLGQAVMDLEAAIDQMKVEMGIAESVRSVRQGLDRIVDDAVERILYGDRAQRRIGA